MVGGLVEQQQVGRSDTDDRQLEPRPLPTGELLDGLEDVVAAEEKPGQVAARGSGVETGGAGERVDHCRAGMRRAADLGEVADLYGRAYAQEAVERREVAGDGAQQRGLARAVGADDSDAIATSRFQSSRP